MSTYTSEFRGTDNLVYAEVTVDNNETGDGQGYVTGEVKILAPVAEISRTTETSTATSYYDNKPANVINAEGSDTITLTVPVVDLTTLADITGKQIDAATGAFMDGVSIPKYFALGYRLRLTDGTYRYVWRYKGSFAIPDETSQTENDGTDVNNQQLTYTGIMTQHKFTKAPDAQGNPTSQKALVVDERDGKANLTNFFDQVTTCDTLQAASPASAYTLSITEDSGTTVTVERNGVELNDGASLNSGDVLTISVTGGTIEVNGSAFTSGNTYNVTGNVTIVSTAD